MHEQNAFACAGNENARGLDTSEHGARPSDSSLWDPTRKPLEPKEYRDTQPARTCRDILLVHLLPELLLLLVLFVSGRLAFALVVSIILFSLRRRLCARQKGKNDVSE